MLLTELHTPEAAELLRSRWGAAGRRPAHGLGSMPPPPPAPCSVYELYCDYVMKNPFQEMDQARSAAQRGCLPCAGAWPPAGDTAFRQLGQTRWPPAPPPSCRSSRASCLTLRWRLWWGA